MSAMWPYFTSLIARAWQAFLTTEGTTGVGWVGDKIVLPLGAFAATVVILRWRAGKAAVKQHWGNTLTVAFAATVGVFVLWHGAIFGWKIVSVAYDDHIASITKNLQQQLTDCQSTSTSSKEAVVKSATTPLQKKLDKLQKENLTLSSELAERKENLHVGDRGFQRFDGLVDTFRAFKNYPSLPKLTTIGDDRECEIKISWPFDDSQSTEVAKTFQAAIKMAQACITFTPFDGTDFALSPSLRDEARSEAEKGMEDAVILMHVSDENERTPWTNYLLDQISNVAPVKRVTGEMPKQREQPSALIVHPSPPILWLQVGRNVKWKR